MMEKGWTSCLVECCLTDEQREYELSNARIDGYERDTDTEMELLGCVLDSGSISTRSFVEWYVSLHPEIFGDLSRDDPELIDKVSDIINL